MGISFKGKRIIKKFVFSMYLLHIMLKHFRATAHKYLMHYWLYHSIKFDKIGVYPSKDFIFTLAWYGSAIWKVLLRDINFLRKSYFLFLQHLFGFLTITRVIICSYLVLGSALVTYSEVQCFLIVVAYP